MSDQTNKIIINLRLLMATFYINVGMFITGVIEHQLDGYYMKLTYLSSFNISIPDKVSQFCITVVFIL